ncbi:MAG: mitochondrial escape protein 2 [Watsoniomyces obsoletus]|nr:MAG: mitochondrial escape protein 2 [Watsoniomyces obsoletus]
MATITQHRLRGRPAHTPGPTYLCYTTDGQRLVTVGSNNAIRVYSTGSVGEPVTIDDSPESNAAVAAGSNFFLVGSEDGTVSKYSLESNSLEQVLVRCTLPVRDVVLSPDGRWAAVASDELVVKLVDVNDMTRVRYLREQSKPVKHLSFHPTGLFITISCADGVLYVYSLSKEEPELVKKVEGLIPSLETDTVASSKAVWHPDGRAFAAPTTTRDVQVMSWEDWERQRRFSAGHTSDITALAWSPNGALLATAGKDGKIVLWDSKTQKVLSRYDYANVMSLAWHPTENIFCFATTDGEVYIYPDFVSTEHHPLLQKPLQPAPYIHDPLAEVSANARRPPPPAQQGPAEGGAAAVGPRRKRARTPDSLDDLLPSEDEDDGLEGFIVDDDGAGYADDTNGHGKRSRDELDGFDGPAGKRRAVYHQAWEPQLHEAFQPGSTPWRGNRRYLCLNLVGCVWSVDQDTHHTVTVEFYDREYHRDFHFTDPYRYDKACLNDTGTLFSCPPSDEHPSMIFYRPHETWTSRADWRTQLPEGEHVIAMSLSDSFIVVTTSTNYVRVFTLYGTPFRVYRQKSSPTVTCASWRDYVLTMGNGPVGGNGRTQLMYTIENIKRDEICQSEDVVALPEGAEVKSVFFSDTGDPCIYDSLGILLILLHWRTPNQARWVPLLDTKQLQRLAGGRKEESYFPVAVAQEKFHCIILKGGDQYPYFPRPLLSEFDFQIPLGGAPTSGGSTSAALTSDERTSLAMEEGNNNNNETTKLEESFVRNSLGLDLLEDLQSATTTTSSERAQRIRKQTEVDKVLLQLLAIECREGEERGMKALEIVGLMRDRTGRMLEAAGKVARRYDRNILAERIRELAERRLVEVEDE